MKKRSSIMKDLSMLQDDQVNASITTVANDSLTIKGKVTDISQGRSSGLQNISDVIRLISIFEYTLTYDKDKKIKNIKSLKEDQDVISLGYIIGAIYECGPLNCSSSDINDYTTLEIGTDTFKLMFPKNDTAYISFKNSINIFFIYFYNILFI
jgi:hypothetical protein